MSKTLFELHEEQKSNCTYDDFPIGTPVKIVTPCQDHYFFYGEAGKVIKNTRSYLGIAVEFDKPRHFEGGYIQTSFNFEPEDLKLLVFNKYVITYYNRYACEEQTFFVIAQDEQDAERLFWLKYNKESYGDCIQNILEFHEEYFYTEEEIKKSIK